MDNVNVCVLYSCLILSLIGWSLGADQVTEHFSVQPGGEKHSFDAKLGSFRCKFIYVCQGGTNEEWEMVLEKDDNDIHSCTVMRPQGTSYLFFQTVKLMVKGAKLLSAEAYGNQDHQLSNEEIVIDHSHNEVHSSKEHFNSQLALLTVTASTSKTEL